MKNKGLKLCVSVSALAAATVALPQMVNAQASVSAQIPIADVQCDGVNTFNRLTSCSVSGERTNTGPTVTVTPSATRPGFSTVTHSDDVTFNGNLQVGGAVFATSPSTSFLLPPQFLYEPGSVSVDASLAYTGTISATVPDFAVSSFASQLSNPLGQFQRYDIQELDVQAINVDIQNFGLDTRKGLVGEDYNFRVASVDPTAVVDNSTALAGNYSGSNEDGALVFGKITGTATVIAASPGSAVFTESELFRNPDGSASSVFISPLGMQIETSAVETTRLDENGLVTPTIAVSDGINMNGSRITNLGDAVNGSDAVNLAQVTHLIATSGPVQNSEGDGALAGGSGSSASGNGAVALGQQQTANGNGAVAIGDPNTATGTGAVAIGADNTATGKGAVALGNRNVATGPGAVAIGSDSTAAQIGNVALGFNAEATGAGASALGSNTIASATNSTAVGYGAEASGANALAVGYQSSATGGSSTAIGTNASASAVNSSAIGLGSSATAQNSVALGQGSVANQVNTVSVGAAGAERRVVNVAAAVNATDAVNKGQFDAESTQRKAAEALLQTNLTAEANARVAGDAALQTALNSEASTRSAADAALQQAINLEANTRSAAVTSLQNGLDGEAAARLAADTAEANKRAAEDTRLYETISEEGARRLAADNAEANARAAADNRLQGQINTLGTSLFSLTGRVTTLENTVKQDRKDARQGIAAAVAMTPAPMPSAPGKVAYTVNVANFRDEQAVAASLAMRLRGPNPMAVTAGISYGGGANTAVRVGVAGEF